MTENTIAPFRKADWMDWLDRRYFTHQNFQNIINIFQAIIFHQSNCQTLGMDSFRRPFYPPNCSRSFVLQTFFVYFSEIFRPHILYPYIKNRLQIMNGELWKFDIDPFPEKKNEHRQRIVNRICFIKKSQITKWRRKGEPPTYPCYNMGWKRYYFSRQLTGWNWNLETHANFYFENWKEKRKVKSNMETTK